MQRLKNLWIVLREGWRFLGEAKIQKTDDYLCVTYKDLGFYITKEAIRLYSKRIFIIDNHLLCNNFYKDKLWVELDYLKQYSESIKQKPISLNKANLFKEIYERESEVSRR